MGVEVPLGVGTPMPTSDELSIKIDHMLRKWDLRADHDSLKVLVPQSRPKVIREHPGKPEHNPIA